MVAGRRQRSAKGDHCIGSRLDEIQLLGCAQGPIGEFGGGVIVAGEQVNPCQIHRSPREVGVVGEIRKPDEMVGQELFDRR